MEQHDKERFLTEHGWSQWYNPDYWVNPKVLHPLSKSDYTNWGLSTDEAIEFEKSGKKWL